MERAGRGVSWLPNTWHCFRLWTFRRRRYRGRVTLVRELHAFVQEHRAGTSVARSPNRTLRGHQGTRGFQEVMR